MQMPTGKFRGISFIPASSQVLRLLRAIRAAGIMVEEAEEEEKQEVEAYDDIMMAALTDFELLPQTDHQLPMEYSDIFTQLGFITLFSSVAPFSKSPDSKHRGLFIDFDGNHGSKDCSSLQTLHARTHARTHKYQVLWWHSCSTCLKSNST